MEENVLSFLSQNNLIQDSFEYADKNNYNHQELVGIFKSLIMDEFIVANPFERQGWVLTAEGQQVSELGTPEFRIFQMAKQTISEEELYNQLGKEMYKVGFTHCMKQKWITYDKAAKKVTSNNIELQDEVSSLLKKIGKNEEVQQKDMENLKKRKLIVLQKNTGYRVEKGPKFNITRRKQEADLTSEMIQSGKWMESSFKPYNFKAKGQTLAGGHLHPLLKVRAELRNILIEMGFTEMPTNDFVQSSFWNFDALFQPQQHPARDMHDTFFLKDPEKSVDWNQEYQERVQKTHEEGGYGSIGYRYKWNIEEAKKNILRTHTTAVSARMLYKLAQEGFKPAKYFSIDRVFRNETLDATHLAEFHQIEGFVVEKNIGLGHLKGIIATFFKKMGITNLKFKPAYNPYTEPSMEVFGYHPILKKWTEIGNSGIFRPEMLRPMGLPPDVQVIAWGLSLERPTMIQYGIANIRDLFGHKVQLAKVEENPICSF